MVAAKAGSTLALRWTLVKKFMIFLLSRTENSLTDLGVKLSLNSLI